MGHEQFKFKSSGLRTSNRKFSKPTTILRPIGIKTPMQLDDGMFKMHNNPVETLADNFRNLVMTNFGERLGRYEFGTNLRAILFELSTYPDFEERVTRIIIDATQNFMPQINISNVVVQQIDRMNKFDRNRVGLAIVKIVIAYNIPAFNSKILGLEVEFLLGG